MFWEKVIDLDLIRLAVAFGLILGVVWGAKGGHFGERVGRGWGFSVVLVWGLFCLFGFMLFPLHKPESLIQFPLCRQ